jgi:hypothetical protein
LDLNDCARQYNITVQLQKETKTFVSGRITASAHAFAPPASAWRRLLLPGAACIDRRHCSAMGGHGAKPIARINEHAALHDIVAYRFVKRAHARDLNIHVKLCA